MTSVFGPGDIERILALAAPSERIAAWHVAPDAYPALTPSTEALERVVANTLDGRRVSVFVKTIRSLRHSPLLADMPEPLREVAIAHFPWRLEADVYGSGLLGILPPGIRGPAIYAIDDLGDDRVRIWMEDVPGADRGWDLARYAAAARRLGRLAGRTLRDGLPAGSPTLSGGIGQVFAMRTSVVDVPALRTEATWRHPLMAAAAAQDPALRGDLLTLADEAPAILGALDRLPRALAHGDSCPQNLLPDPSSDDGFVLIDWGFASLAPVGSDLVPLLAGRAESGDLTAEHLPAIEATIVPAYLEGLREERTDPDPEAVRLGYLGGLLVGKALSALPLERLGQPIDGAAAALFRERARYARYLLDLRRELKPAP